MSNEVVIKSSDVFALAEGLDAEIIDSEAPIIFSDLVTENRVANGVVYLSLAAIHTDGTNRPKVRVVSRHRIGLVHAQVLRDMLTSLINEATKPVDKSQAN